MPERRFPEGFLWGTATSSHQVEGGQYNDWTAAEKAGVMVYNGQLSGIACDWWNRAEEDFDRMVDLGTNAHRLSLEWSRIEPHPGQWNEAALVRYREMLQGLHARGITPMVTLHHFTNPVWMVERGGWENPESVDWFEAYVRHVVRYLGDLVPLWCTINEPMVMVGQGWMLGLWPPGKRSMEAARRATINLAKAHAAAYHAIHDLDADASVGLAKHMVSWNPDRVLLPTDHLMARLVNDISNHAFLRAITQGFVRVPGFGTIEIEGGHASLDWLGVNYYQRYNVGLRLRHIIPLLLRRLDTEVFYQRTRDHMPQGPGGWGEFHARGLYEHVRDVQQYGVPIYITENGIPTEHDDPRGSFLVEHLEQLWYAIQDGADVQGYFHWSLLDNFEWAEGYNPEFRFGLYAVDFPTQKRTPRPSALIYERICRANAIPADMVEAVAHAG